MGQSMFQKRRGVVLLSLVKAGEESTISSQPLTVKYVNYVVNLTVMLPRMVLK